MIVLAGRVDPVPGASITEGRRWTNVEMRSLGTGDGFLAGGRSLRFIRSCLRRDI